MSRYSLPWELSRLRWGYESLGFHDLAKKCTAEGTRGYADGAAESQLLVAARH